jgi:NAD(P)-dependent dehydrogenase (short-subunit alcohol dehydrogenase family)
MPIPQEWDLTGKTALITSDKRGWTPFLASALAEAGAAVVVAGADGSDGSEAVAAIEKQGSSARFLATDVTDTDAVAGAVSEAVSRSGRVDVLVNNAQAEFGKPFVEVTDQEWQTAMDFNVKSTFLFCRAAGRHMLDRGGGRIVNITSGLAVRGLWNSAVACAGHGAVHQLTSALGLEWARSNIRVNGIGAGWISTEPHTEESQKELLVRYLPSRRKGHPTDLAGLLVYLASDACDFVAGQTVFIDGGALAHA